MEIGKPKRVYTIEPIRDPVRRIREAPQPLPAPVTVPLPLPDRREAARP